MKSSYDYTPKLTQNIDAKRTYINADDPKSTVALEVVDGLCQRITQITRIFLFYHLTNRIIFCFANG